MGMGIGMRVVAHAEAKAKAKAGKGKGQGFGGGKGSKGTKEGGAGARGGVLTAGNPPPPRRGTVSRRNESLNPGFRQPRREVLEREAARAEEREEEEELGTSEALALAARRESSYRAVAARFGGGRGGAGEAAASAARVAASEAETAAARKKVADEVRGIVDGLDEGEDVFWQLLPHILRSEFPESELQRVLGFVDHTVGRGALPDALVQDKWRPHGDLHAFMPGLPDAQPFHEPAAFPFVAELEAEWETVLSEFRALEASEAAQTAFQSVTSMNYDSGWKTLVLFYNGHEIEGFPYHLCPVTKRILDKVPVAGRIAGFNRQAPGTGIPLHSDGNNMWLTAQLGLVVPDPPSDEGRAWIRVGPETRTWTQGETLVYDTTYEHETFNPSPDQERIVFHVDFWNFTALSPVEIQAMRKCYALRERYLAAEGVKSVQDQRLGSR